MLFFQALIRCILAYSFVYAVSAASDYESQILLDSSSSLAHSDASSGEFNPARCAQLHNQLVALAQKRHASVDLESVKFFDAYENEEQKDRYKKYLSADLTRFLSDIYVLRPKALNSWLWPYLSPYLQQPHPSNFFSTSDFDPDNEYPYLVFLYPYDEESGVFFDMATNLAIMTNYFYGWPHPLHWYPLEDLLRRHIDFFQNEKFYWIDEDRRLGVRPYVWQDVDMALKAYHSLINLISCHLPVIPSTALDQPLVDTSTLNKWGIKGFAYEFLSRAKTPTFKFIAPGVTIINATFLNKIMFDDIDSERSRVVKQRYHDVELNSPILLFPGTERITEDRLDFFESYGEGKILFENNTGLYLNPDWNFEDSVSFFTPFPIGDNGHFRGGMNMHIDDEIERSRWQPKGHSVLWQHGGCPFFHNHRTRLFLLLQSWELNIQRGTWTVGENGVEGGMDMYKLADTEDHYWEYTVGACW